jgi:O-antigen/teichoic acid export membrane protein
MNLPRNVSINTVARVATSIIEKALIFVVMALLARRLGSEGLGVYSFALAYITFFRLLTDWGISPIVIKRLSTAPEQDRAALFGATLTLRIILTVLAALVAGLSFSFGAAPALLKASIWVATLTFADMITDICASLLMAELKQAWLGILEACNRLLWCAAALATLYQGGAVIALLVVLGCSSLVQMASALWLVRRLLPRLALKVHWTLWKNLLSESWPLALQGFMSTVYLRVDQLLLYLLVGVAAIGYYSAATKIAEGWGLVVGVFQAAVFPLMCRFYAADRERFEKTAHYSLRYIFIGIFPFAVACTLYAPAILRLVFGADFSRAAPALTVLMWAEVFLVGNMICQATLVAAGLQKCTFWLALAAAGSNVLLNLLLIPKYGYTGAAWASLISYGMYPVVETLLPQTRPFAWILWREIWRPFSAALAAGTLLRDLPINGLLLAGVGLAAYFAILVSLRGVGLHDLHLLRRALSEKPA